MLHLRSRGCMIFFAGCGIRHTLSPRESGAFNMDNGHLLKSITKPPELPAPSTGTARQSVQLPRNWAEMIERWGEGNIRDVVMRAIETHVMVYANQVREEKTADGRTIPIHHHEQLVALAESANEQERFAPHGGGFVHSWFSARPIANFAQSEDGPALTPWGQRGPPRASVGAAGAPGPAGRWRGSARGR